MLDLWVIKPPSRPCFLPCPSSTESAAPERIIKGEKIKPRKENQVWTGLPSSTSILSFKPYEVGAALSGVSLNQVELGTCHRLAHQRNAGS